METAGSAVGTRSTWTPPAARRREPDRAPRRVRCRAVAMQQPPPPSVRTVAISFADLKVSSRRAELFPCPFRFARWFCSFSDADFWRRPVRVQERGKDLSGKIEEGLGPNGLGIISISDVSIPACNCVRPWFWRRQVESWSSFLD